jgi:hypothetical protein
MAKFLVLWHRNPIAPWPTNPAENLKFMEKIWAGMDNLIKKGEVKEFGFFLDATSGYAISEKDSITAFKNISMFLPYYESEVYEIIPYEKGKEIIRALSKAQAEAAKK